MHLAWRTDCSRAIDTERQNALAPRGPRKAPSSSFTTKAFFIRASSINGAANSTNLGLSITGNLYNQFCVSESTAYEFGPGTGLVTFEYPEGRWPNAHRDLLALGFMTAQKEDATVFRLDSANSNDFMELEIVSDGLGFEHSYHCFVIERKKSMIMSS